MPISSVGSGEVTLKVGLFMEPVRKMRNLGLYLIILAAYQLVLYSFVEGGSNLLALVDPRVGIAIAFVLGRRPITVLSGYLLWIERGTALWLLVIGLAIALRKTKMWVGVYLVSELILAAPTVLILVVSFGPGLRYAPGYFFAGFLVFIVFTVFPLYSAIDILRRKKPL
jgi:hypothetical protein